MVRRVCWWWMIFIMGMTPLARASRSPQRITRAEALRIAEQSPEVRALYALNHGRLQDCLIASVMKPCESDWVSCVEDAWVVRFEVGGSCGIQHDGRLGVFLLIDEVTGRIRSRYPEASYFEKKNYCQDNADCLSLFLREGGAEAVNFIYAPLERREVQFKGEGVCEDNACRIKRRNHEH